MKKVGKVLPILFNSEMVRAIMAGNKTVTRRVVKYKYENTEMKMRVDKYGSRLIEIQKNIEGETYGKRQDGGNWQKLLPYIEKDPPYKKGDILYGKETWAFRPCIECLMEAECHKDTVVYEDKEEISEGCYIYRAEYPWPERIAWKPSIHMPRKAARIWLKVTDIKAERLHNMQILDFIHEGINSCEICPGKGVCLESPGTVTCALQADFVEVWDSTIKKQDSSIYGWNANPWVWVVSFELCERPDKRILTGVEEKK